MPPASAALAIGFDADDTLWHNESIFEKTHERYRALLAQYHGAATVDRTLFATEMKNLELYGYGVKGFTLSAIETAIQLTAGKIRAEEIQHLIDLGREMLAHPVELLAGVEETLADLASRHPLLLITKGDLRDQQRKLAKSRLAPHFRQIEIVAEKDELTYADILRRHGIAARNFLMVGNSVKSDIRRGRRARALPPDLGGGARRGDAPGQGSLLPPHDAAGTARGRGGTRGAGCQAAPRVQQEMTRQVSPSAAKFIGLRGPSAPFPLILNHTT
jgi:putative hydrolase of the HAD superfamily